jgi:hypothetical protein
MRIFDCFTFFNELNLLKIRCEELKSLDVTHVLVEATSTFTGNKKPLYFLENKDWFSEFKIEYFVTDALPNNGNAWDNEKEQRNYIKIALEILGVQDEDLVIISDVDEIPRCESLQSFIPNDELTALRMDKFGYYLNCMEGKQSWERARVMKWKYLKTRTPEEVRNSGFEHELSNAGWHWSWLGGVESMKTKLDSFSHQECNTQELKDSLEEKYNTGQSLWGTDYWNIVPVDETFPKFIQENKESFSQLIFNK